jgi:hypothetical protein
MHNLMQAFVIDGKYPAYIDVGNSGSGAISLAPRTDEDAAKALNQYSLGGISSLDSGLVPSKYAKPTEVARYAANREIALKMIEAYSQLSHGTTYGQLSDDLKAVLGKPLTADAQPGDFPILSDVQTALPLLRT